MSHVAIPTSNQLARGLWFALRRFNDKNGFVMSSHVAIPDNSRAARYSLLVAISGLIGKSEFPAIIT